ncbi:MAG TPA: tripartite tricarboxylate transporter substrate-binding protein [Micropepsaceae bacterium]|nr:tripartite tricarboxylate transporter substrate-binding protein [Micropepsaceae bacterium]
MLKRVLSMALGLAISCSPAYAADSEMFKGKTITYIIATGPGGGYDSYGRLLSRFLQKYLPGTRILVKNVPGAGHIVGANTIYAARPDGLTFGTFNTGLIYDQLLQRGGVKFDLSKFGYIGKASNDTRALVISTKSGLHSFDEVLKSKTPVKFAASGIGSAAYIETRILQNALNVPIQIVPGFDGNEGEMSMLRNEVVAEVGTANSLEPFVKNRGGFFALALTDSDSLPGVPKAMTYAKDERAKRLLNLVSTLSLIGRLTAGPPGMPPATLAVLREAFTATMKDPAYIAEAKRLGLPLDPASGDKVEAMVKQALAQPPETIAELKRAASQ